jgi:hypothetical protein
LKFTLGENEVQADADVKYTTGQGYGVTLSATIARGKSCGDLVIGVSVFSFQLGTMCEDSDRQGVSITFKTDVQRVARGVGLSRVLKLKRNGTPLGQLLFGVVNGESSAGDAIRKSLCGDTWRSTWALVEKDNKGTCARFCEGTGNPGTCPR